MVSVTACSGGGGGGSIPAARLASNGNAAAASNATSSVLASRSAERRSPSMTYSAPYGGQGDGDAIYLLAANGCGMISATPATASAFPAEIIDGTLPAGTPVTLSGVARDADGRVITSGCPTGGIVTKTLRIANAAPSPAPPSTTAMTYKAPYGGRGGGDSIYLLAANGCGMISVTPGANAFPDAVANGTLASGTPVTVIGAATSSTGGIITSGCPTGGILATTVTIGATGVASSPAPPPVPAVTASCVTLSAAYNQRDLPSCFVPYVANSTWNRPLPTSPQLAADSQDVMDFMWSGSFGTGMASARIGTPYDPATDYMFPYYFSGSSDPLVTIHCFESWGSCAIEGARIRIPAFARHAGGGSDKHLTIVDSANGDEYDMYEAQDSAAVDGSVYTIGWGAKTNVVTGSGWGSAGTAGGTAQLAGMVRVAELQAGVIRHALQMSTACNLNGSPVYPAQSTAYQPCLNGLTGATMPIGSRVWLDLAPSDVAALPVSTATKTVLNALHAYGAFITDTNGNSAPMSIVSAQQSPTQFVAAGAGDIVGNWYAANVPKISWNNAEEQLDIWSAVDWRTHLHVVAPCVTQGSC